MVNHRNKVSHLPEAPTLDHQIYHARLLLLVYD